MDSSPKQTAMTDLMDIDGCGMVCFIGAGGKTTLMYTLAAEIRHAGKRVLTTTTTKIFYPSQDQCTTTLIDTDISRLLETSAGPLRTVRHLTAGFSHDTDSGKVTGFTAEAIDRIYDAAFFDWILVEADGAKRRPVKASNPTEPVIPSATTHTVLIAGLDAVGRPLDSRYIHRPEIFSRNTGLEMGRPVTAEALARNISLEIDKAKALCRSARFFVFLNKSDSRKRAACAIRIFNTIKETNPAITCMTGCLEPEMAIQQV